jgi:acylphosphatase
MALCRLFTIKGRVQGVFFRDSTRRVAQTLGISGYAINLRNGNVEVLACGESSSVDELAAWLQDGPQMARVDEVTARDIEVDAPDDFQTG